MEVPGSLRLAIASQSVLLMAQLMWHPGTVAAGSVGGASASSATAASPRPHPQGFEALADRMEVIRPEEIQLVKFLGAGGYGGAAPFCVSLSRSSMVSFAFWHTVFS